MVHKIQKEVGEGKWIHIPTEFTERKINVSNAEYSKLSYWGLIEGKPNEDDDTKRDSGFWRITPLGIDFVNGKCSTCRHVFLYNKKRYGSSDETTTIKEALGDKFDYAELMGYPSIDKDGQSTIF